MILIFDNLVNNYLNILSCIILLYIFKLTKNKYLVIVLIDILLNKIPYITIIFILIYFLNKFIFKKLINNNLNSFILM